MLYSLKSLTSSLKLLDGSRIPRIGFGTAFKSDGKIEDFKNALRTAILYGNYKHIDCAWYYKTEKYVGEVLNEIFKSSQNNLNRSDLFITSKVWPCFWNDPEISLNQSLNDLKLDYLNLYIQHWPACFEKKNYKDDININNGRIPTPIDSNGKTLIDSNGDYLITYKKLLNIKKTSNKIKSIGVSNYSIPMLKRLIDETGTKPVVNQIELHPCLPQFELYNFCKSNDIIIEAYSPFGSLGAPILKFPFIKNLANAYNITPADLVISYLMKRNVVCLPRSTNIERLKKGFNLINLSNDDMEKFNEFSQNNSNRFIDKDWAYWNN